VINGQYIYGAVKQYSVKEYCEGRFEKSKDEKLKTTLVALLNYGAAAQTYFKEHTDDLANADLESYVEKYNLNRSYLGMNWSNDYLTDVAEPSESMTVNFQSTGTVTDDGKSLILKGAISVKYYMGVGMDATVFENAKEKTFYFWTAKDYAALESKGEPLSKDNASYTVEGTLAYDKTYGWEYSAKSDGIFAMYYGDTLYACLCIEDSTGQKHCSGVVTYSPEVFAAGKINDNKAADIDPVVQWLVVYGERAKAYLSK
jgi:hypothetical protein